MRNVFKVILPSLLIVLFIGGCGDENSTNKNSENKTLEIGSNNKDISNLVSEKRFFLNSVENGDIVVVKKGNDFFLENQQTKLVIFDLFSTWCPACKMVAPHLSNLQKQYSKDLLVVGVVVEENKADEDVIAFKKRYKANYMVVNSTNQKRGYQNFKLSNELATLVRQPRSFPIPLLIMFKDGKYFTHYIGAVPEEMIESDIKEALKK